MSLNRWVGAWALSWVLFSVTPALAQKRVVVMDFDGPMSTQVRAQIVGALSDSGEVEVVSVKEVNAASQKLGVGTNNADDLTKIASELQISAFIEGEVSKEGKNFRTLTRVRNAATGDVVHEEPWVRNKKTLKTIRGKFWDVMKPHILATEAPPKAEEPEPEPEPKPDAMSMGDDDEAPADDEEPEEEAGPTGESLTHPSMVAYVGPKFLWRSLAFEEGTGLSSYKNEAASPGISAALGLALFPGAFARADWLSDLGLEVDFEYTLGLTSQEEQADGSIKELSTTHFELDANLAYRIMLSTFEIRPRLGYLKHTFEVEGSALLPPVSYSGVRLGAGFYAHLAEAFTVDVSIGYDIVFDAGDLASEKYASELSASAFEAAGGVTWRFLDQYGARFGVDFRRYFLDFGNSSNAAIALPKSGDDDYFRMLLAFVYTMPGKVSQ
jgi:hypothetical protein